MVSRNGSPTVKPCWVKKPLLTRMPSEATASRFISAQTTIDRRDFGLTWNQALEAGGVLVGHEVKIDLQVQAVQAEEAIEETDEASLEAAGV